MDVLVPLCLLISQVVLQPRLTRVAQIFGKHWDRRLGKAATYGFIQGIMMLYKRTSTLLSADFLHCPSTKVDQVIHFVGLQTMLHFLAV